MATTYTIEQQPNQVAGDNNPQIFVLKESAGAITGADKFRYIAQVFINDVEKVKLKIHKNKAGVAIIDVHKIVRSFLETQENAQLEDPSGTFTIQTGIKGSIHAIGCKTTTKPYSSNTSQLAKVTIKAGYETATSATTAPTETLDKANYTYVSIVAGTPFTQTDTNEGGLDIDGANYPLNNYLPTDNTRKFLTNSPYKQFVRGSSTSADNKDLLTLGFVQEGNLVTDGVPIGRMYVVYYNSSGGVIDTHFFKNELAKGGISTADDVKNHLLYFGCGTKNLETQTTNADAKPSDATNNGWAYYKVYGADDAGNVKTNSYCFYRYGQTISGSDTPDDRHQSCTRYDNVRLAWRNRLGCWDYMNFRGKSQEKVDFTSSQMERVPGTWDNATYNYDNWDRGKKTIYTEAFKTTIVNSDFLNEEESAWLEELFTSTNVHIVNDDFTIMPVVIKDKSYIKKTSVNNKVKLQYIINLEHANKINTNS
jgi:hypothetical protein